MQQKFASCLDRLLSGVGPGRVGVCVSGGPDSIALLRLALLWNKRPVVALHVNHRVREESDAEEQWLRQKLANVPVLFRRLEWKNEEKQTHENLRRLRFAAFGEMAREGEGLQALMLAHHADDMGETFVERVQMASGLAGLARPMSEISFLPGLPPLLRPVLKFSKHDLRSTLSPSDDVLHDPSNSNPKYLRSRVRLALDETPNARLLLCQVQQLVQREWNAVELASIDKSPSFPNLSLLASRGVDGEASRLALHSKLAQVTGSPRLRSSFVLRVVDWMIRPETTSAPVSVFCESGVRIEWRQKTKSFKSALLFLVFFFCSPFR